MIVSGGNKMRDAIARLEAERRNLWHDVGIHMQDAFDQTYSTASPNAVPTQYPKKSTEFIANV
jgi:hypothetical protein